MTSKGSISNYQIQTIEGNIIYPQDFFNSYDDATGQLNITDNTRSIHWSTRHGTPKPPMESISQTLYPKILWQESSTKTKKFE